MESTHLSNFYRAVAQWPKTPMEINALAVEISRLLGAPFTAVYLVQNEETTPRLGFRIEDSKLRLGHDPNAPMVADLSTLPSIVEDFVKKHLKAVSSPPGSLFKQIQVSGDLFGGYHLGIVPVITTKSGIQKNHGAIFAAFPKAFTAKEEILIVSIAQHLVGLAENDSLDSEIQIRSQFLSIASHELKTPLTSIYGMLQLQERSLRLKRDDPMFKEPERQLSHIRRMIRQVERLNELIDGLLDISRIQNGRFMVEPSEVDVAGIVRETISTRLDSVAKEAGTTLHVDAPTSLMAWVDPIRMEEVISNLAMNAIRFSPEGGVVWIRLTPEADAFRLTIRDQGPNVPIEDRERIFKPFERAQRTARLGGLGLGLFISRQIALLHGGNVTLVESIPGKGNVFEAHFPLRAAVQASA